MGGVKKKSLASMEKSQDSQDGAQEQAAPKGKKSKEKAPFQQKKQLPFLLPRSTDAELVKTLTPLKAITVYSASRALGVNSSIASTVIKDLEGKKLLRRAGGYSGHGVWAVKS